MRIFNHIFSLLLVSALFGAQGDGKDTAAQGRDMFATRWEMSKGGIGMINKKLYVVVKSAANERNELIVKPTEETEERWHGKGVTKAEVVVFYEGKVWSSDELPDGFDLSNSVVISFESDKVRFFDFQAMRGAYFERIRD